MIVMEDASGELEQVEPPDGSLSIRRLKICSGLPFTLVEPGLAGLRADLVLASAEDMKPKDAILG
jgi:hypothetical protein